MSNHSQFHITVANIVESQQQFLLVSENIDGHIVYNQPAGHLEANESLTEAMIRETLEETGYLVRPQALVGIYLYQADETHTFLRVCFTSELIEQQSPKPLDKDITARHWLDYSQILQKTDEMRSPLVIKCIDDYNAGKRYSLEILNTLL